MHNNLKLKTPPLKRSLTALLEHFVQLVATDVLLNLRQLIVIFVCALLSLLLVVVVWSILMDVFFNYLLSQQVSPIIVYLTIALINLGGCVLFAVLAYLKLNKLRFFYTFSALQTMRENFEKPNENH